MVGTVALLQVGDTLYLPLLAVTALAGSRSRSRASHSTHSPGYEFRCEAARSRLRTSRSSATLHPICGLVFPYGRRSGRSCVSAGIICRASSTRVGSISAQMNPGSSPPSASTVPHGSTISECPKVARPHERRPHWPGANTKLPVSIARARINTCQCACPVVRVKAAGTVRKDAPAWANIRYR